MKESVKHNYSAVFAPAQEGGYNVSFPDFPGCVTFGRNFEEAQVMGQEALELWIEELKAQGEEIPTSNEPALLKALTVKIPASAKIKLKRHAAAKR